MEEVQRNFYPPNVPFFSGALNAKKSPEITRSPFDFSVLDEMLNQEPGYEVLSSPTSISSPEISIGYLKRGSEPLRRSDRFTIDVDFDQKETLPAAATFSSEVCSPLDNLKSEVSSITFPRVSLKNRINQFRNSSLFDSISPRNTLSESSGCKVLNGACNKKVGLHITKDSKIAKAIQDSKEKGGKRLGDILDENVKASRVTFWSSKNHLAIRGNQLSELPRPGQTFGDLFQPEIGGGNLEAVNEKLPTGIVSEPPEVDISSLKTAAEAVGTGTPSLPNSSRASLDLSVNGWKNKVNNSPNFKGRTESVSSKKRRQSSFGIKLLKTVEPTIWWLDISSPSREEMQIIGKAFNIHPLTVDSILTQEPREKVEIFRHYYFVCYQSFDCSHLDRRNLQPISFYILVFREGILTFHLPPTSHPSNVRRRIHNWKDHINLTTDWICYALIDDITGIHSPLISQIECEIDAVNKDDILGTKTELFAAVVRCRQEVIELSRLLKNKIDVVKALSKRCSEEPSHILTPDSDISLYLSDVQDHLMNMTQNLDHYERIISRCHSDYLAVLSIEIAASGSRVNQILGRLTALGSIVVPTNLICTVWGMNIYVPGQTETPNLTCFYVIIGSSLALGLLGIWVMNKYFRI